MKYIKTLTLKQDFLSQLQLKTAIVMLAISALVPILVHLIPPFQGIPMGKLLLPMFYAPLLAVILFRYHVGLIAGVLAPVVSFMITGNPALNLMSILSIELAVFVTAVYFMNKNNITKWFSAPLGFVIAKTFSAGLILAIPSLMGVSAVSFWVSAMSVGVVGIAVLLIINILAVKIKS